MTIMKYGRPETDLFGKRFSDIMDEFFSDAVANRRSSFSPGIDISETETQYVVDVELSGIEKKDIDLNIENNRLTISGERKFEKTEDGKQYHRVETSYGTFSRSLQLPENVNPDSIKASYKDGILNVSIDKSEEKLKKQIEIK